MYFKLNQLPVLLIATSFMACVNLKAVNDYAVSSKEIIDEFNDFKVSITDSQMELMELKCLIDNAKFPPPDIFDKCYNHLKLKSTKKADSLIIVLITVIGSYHQGIVDLSDNKVTSFELDSENLESLLGNNKDRFKITDGQIGAGKRLVEFLTNVSTSSYRSNKLKEIIAKSNEDIIELLGLLNQIIDNLITIVDTDIDSYHKLYTKGNGLITHNTYAEYLRASTKKKGLLKSYKVAIVKLQKGHNELSNAKKLKTKHIIGLIASYTTEILEIKNELDKQEEDE